jgi:TPR repeat protein
VRVAIGVLSFAMATIYVPAPANPPDLPGVKANLKDQLAFTCAYEADKLPKLDPEADKLFKRARWLQKKNLIKKDRSVNPVVERLYRIAAAWGHDKANHNLAIMLMKGQSTATDLITKPVELAEDLIKRGIPQGYYDMGVLLDRGYGVTRDPKAALVYFRKAADLGNPEAQYYVAEKLQHSAEVYSVPWEVGNQMKRCAAEQGHKDAAKYSGNDISSEVSHNRKGTYTEAVKYFQYAVKSGDEISADTLKEAFLSPAKDNTLYYLGLEKDEERSRRYGVLSDILGKYSYLDPTVDEIDEIVPLPPAKLPPWDGEIKFQKEWKKNVPPPLPSEERIAEMAKAKGLDPETGRPVRQD